MQIKNVLNMQRLISNDIPPWQFKVCYYCQVNKYAIIIKFNLTVGLFFLLLLNYVKKYTTMLMNLILKPNKNKSTSI